MYDMPPLWEVVSHRLRITPLHCLFFQFSCSCASRFQDLTVLHLSPRPPLGTCYNVPCMLMCLSIWSRDGGRHSFRKLKGRLSGAGGSLEGMFWGSNSLLQFQPELCFQVFQDMSKWLTLPSPGLPCCDDVFLLTVRQNQPFLPQLLVTAQLFHSILAVPGIKFAIIDTACLFWQPPHPWQISGQANL